MAIDVDNDGRITYHELSKFVRLQDAKHKTTSLAIQIFNKIDSSGNGSVDRYEFDNAMRSSPELKRYMNLLEEKNVQNNATTTTTTPRQTTTTTTTSTPASIDAQVVVADVGLLSATNFAVIPDGHAVATGGNASNQYAVDTTEGSGTSSIFDKIDVNHDSEISWIEFDQVRNYFCFFEIYFSCALIYIYMLKWYRSANHCFFFFCFFSHFFFFFSVCINKQKKCNQKYI